MHAAYLDSCLSRSRWQRRVALLGVSCVAILLAGNAPAQTDIATVYAATANGYTRERFADGAYKSVTYAFANGGRWDGQVVDKSLDGVPFVNVAHAIAGPLQQQNFVMSADPKTVEQMIMVFWGSTTGADRGQYRNAQPAIRHALAAMHHYQNAKGYAERMVQPHGGATAALPWPSSYVEGMMNVAQDELGQALLMNQAENAMRDRNNSTNAVILGFWDDYNKAMDLPTFAFANTIVEELEADRYFVVLKAYDFQLLRTQKVKKLLWETRFSVREQNNRFDTMLPIMAQRASMYFGQNSRHLLREVVPVGRVDVGTPTIVEQNSK